MSAVIESNMQLTPIARAKTALASVEMEAKLKELAKASVTILTITNQDGREQCHSALMSLVKMRTHINKTRKVACEDALAFRDAAIVEEKRLVAIISPEENRLQQIRDTWDEAREAEKQARIDEEIARAAEIQRRIDAIRDWPVQATGKPSTVVAQLLDTANNHVIEAAVFWERIPEAASVLLASIAALTGLHAAALEREAEAERIRLGMLELAKLKAEAVERDRLAAEAREKAEAEAHAKRVADARAHAEQIRLDREKLAKEEADAKAIIESERKKVADQRAENDRANEAERVKQAEGAALLISQREAFEAEQRALEEARRPKPIVEPKIRTKIKTPSREEILQLIAGHYQVDQSIVRYWLSGINWAEVAA